MNDVRAGRDPAVLAKLASGWACFGHQQFVAGYLLLLPDPVVPHLNALDGARRAQFLSDMAHLGDALMRTLDPVRINYAIFGNVEPALHAHVVPRFTTEPEAMRTQHPWAYDWSAAPVFDARAAAPLAERLRAELTKLGALPAS